MKKKDIIFVSVIGIIILSGIVAYVIKYNKALATNKIDKIALYTIPDKQKVFINGVITPEKSENIFLDNTKGSVNKIYITNGQMVNKGNPLFTYKNDQITDQIEQLNKQSNSSNNQKKMLIDKQADAKKLLAKQQGEAKNQTVQTGTENNATIVESQTASTEAQISNYQDQIDSLQNQINTNQDEIKSLKEKEFATVTSPTDGKVLLSDSQKDLTKPFIIIESTSFYIKGNINEKDQPKLKENQSADILVLSTNKTLTGKVKSIANRPLATELSAESTVGGSSNNISYYEVNISFDSKENITDGFHVQATINLTDDVIKIPKSSIFEEVGKKYVFKVVDKKLIKQEITYEESNSSDVVARSGLKENDSIASNAKDMKEGMSVE